MSAPTAPAGGTRFGSVLQMPWLVIALLALVIDLADGFWATSLHQAVGAIERTQEPFDQWLRSSALMFPFFLAAVVLAAVVARHWVGRSGRRALRPAAVALLVVVTTTVVGIAEVAVNAVFDYRVQARRLAGVHAHHPSAAVDALRRSTLAVHERAIAYGSVVLLVTNILVVVFLLVMCGHRLWQRATPAAASSGTGGPPGEASALTGRSTALTTARTSSSSMSPGA